MFTKQTRKGLDLLLYNQHIQRLDTMKSTFNTKQGRIPSYEEFYHICMLRCRRIEDDNMDLLERLAKIAKNTDLENTLGSYAESRIQLKKNETET